ARIGDDPHNRAQGNLAGEIGQVRALAIFWLLHRKRGVEPAARAEFMHDGAEVAGDDAVRRSEEAPEADTDFEHGLLNGRVFQEETPSEEVVDLDGVRAEGKKEAFRKAEGDAEIRQPGSAIEPRVAKV